MLPTEKLIWLSLTEPLLPVDVSTELYLQGTIKTYSAENKGEEYGRSIITNNRLCPKCSFHYFSSDLFPGLSLYLCLFCISRMQSLHEYISPSNLTRNNPHLIIQNMFSWEPKSNWVKNFRSKVYIYFKTNKLKNNTTSLPPNIINPTLRNKSFCWYSVSTPSLFLYSWLLLNAK